MTTRQSVIIQLGLLLLIALVGSLLSRSCVTEREKQKAVELKKVAREIGPYPGAKATGDKVVYKTELIYLFTYYESKDDFNQVKEFYDQQLKAKGWTRVETPPSILVGPPDWRRYRKGDYVVVVERDDNGQRDYFDVTFEWNPGPE
jgi:hypothetical protein